MRAVVLETFGYADVMHVTTTASPEPQGEEIRVRVKAFGINRADVMQRRGKYPAPPDAHDPRIPGLEYAGEVDALGPRARERRIGDRVFGVTGGGAYAEVLCVHERATMRIPDALSFEQAAAVPEAFMTAFDALEQGGFTPSGSVLVHAVGSGVGIAAVQLIASAGGIAIATSRTREKLDRAAAYGLAGAALLDAAFDTLARERTGNAGVDIVLDFIGASTFARNVAALRVGGRIVQIGSLGGAKGELDIGLLMFKRAALIGTTLRARPLEEKIALARRFERWVVPRFADGALRPVIDTVFGFEQIADAHRHMEADRNFGKIVVTTS